MRAVEMGNQRHRSLYGVGSKPMLSGPSAASGICPVYGLIDRQEMREEISVVVLEIIDPFHPYWMVDRRFDGIGRRVEGFLIIAGTVCPHRRFGQRFREEPVVKSDAQRSCSSRRQEVLR